MQVEEHDDSADIKEEAPNISVSDVQHQENSNLIQIKASKSEVCNIYII